MVVALAGPYASYLHLTADSRSTTSLHDAFRLDALCDTQRYPANRVKEMKAVPHCHKKYVKWS